MTEQDNGNPFREDRMYAVSDLMEVLQVSRPSIHRWEKSGKIPPPINLPTAGKRWPGRHLIAWYDRQVPQGVEAGDVS
ncbi:MAG: helix-turn-helix domain-containing protein [Phycisphaeraceae bacterium]|nr:helix-turn-helix domain-containing protein [Phycisphaeraceae bacterium]